ncbi:hypothetical protein ACFLR0_00155 [Candidatus Bipolaricaulota bacterium]
MTWEAVWDVLKWVLLVLAAGFVGQFGRFFAQRLIERRRREKAQAKPMDALASESEDAHVELARIDAQTKIGKKRAKAEVKRLKKLDDG